MRYYKRSNAYKASNLHYGVDSGKGYSYDWYVIVDKIKDKVVLNTYNYSVTTCKHKYKIQALLDTLGIKVDLYIEAPEGLQDLHVSIDWYRYQIRELKEKIDNPRSRAKTNKDRIAKIEEYINTIEAIEELL